MTEVQPLSYLLRRGRSRSPYIYIGPLCRSQRKTEEIRYPVYCLLIYLILDRCSWFGIILVPSVNGTIFPPEGARQSWDLLSRLFYFSLLVKIYIAEVRGG